MNKKLLLTGFALCSLLLVSCNNKGRELNNYPEADVEENNNSNENKPEIENPNNGIVTLNNSIEIFNESVEIMKNLSYVQEGGGVSEVNAGKRSYLTIYDYFEHKPNELYFEKVSYGDAVDLFFTKVPTAYARKVYVNGTAAKRSDSSTTNRWDEENGKVFVRDEDWGKSQKTTAEQINSDFGKNGDSYLNFVINDKSITQKSNTCIQDKNGEYVLSFDLVIDKPSNGLNSIGCQGYSKQVETMSGNTLSKIYSIKIDIVLNKDKTVKKYSTEENYCVSAGPFTADVSNTLSYTFKYFENNDDLVVTKF